MPIDEKIPGLTSFSPVFGELRDFVDNNMKGQSEQTRNVFFALAYTEYCREKKSYVARELTLGRNPEDLVNCHRQFETKEFYLKFCLAAEKLANYQSERTKSKVIKQISVVIVKSLNERFGEISKAISRPKIHWLARVGYYLLETLQHAVQIILAAALIYIFSTAVLGMTGFFSWTQSIGRGHLVEGSEAPAKSESSRQ